MVAMAITTALLARKLRVDNQRMRVAINNMSQGLCMFDGNERLVVCNQRYMEMYKLSAEIVKPGCTPAKPARIPHPQRQLFARPD